jgi:hypothetical protein
LVSVFVYGFEDFRFSRKVDGCMWMLKVLGRGRNERVVQVDILYKRKADKVQLVDLDKFDGSVPGGSIFWREEMIKKELKNLPSAERGSYPQWLIPKFSKIEKGSRLTPERIEKLIVKNITLQERNLFVAMLYNREAALAWDFTEIGKVKPEIFPPVQIRTVNYKA